MSEPEDIGDDTPSHLETYQDSTGYHRWKLMDTQGNAIDSSDNGYHSKTEAERAGRAANPGMKVKRS